MHVRSLSSVVWLLAAVACGAPPSRPPDASQPPPDSMPPDGTPPPVDAGLDDFTPEQWATIQMLTPLPAVPPDPTNAYADSAAAARLGQMVFFDKSYSGALIVGDD